MQITVSANPSAMTLPLAQTAVIMIDMQRDFIQPGGFGEALGNDVSPLQKAIAPCAQLLQMARSNNLLVIHTREGHRPDLTDVSPAKMARCGDGLKIGDTGPMGRILIRNEPGQDLVPELYPIAGEPVIDKPGKGAFYSTDLDLILRQQGKTHLIICGVTTEVCVHTTVREANDRGYQCLIPGDCCASYFEEFHRVGLAMLCAQGGIFGHVCQSGDLAKAFGDG